MLSLLCTCECTKMHNCIPAFSLTHFTCTHIYHRRTPNPANFAMSSPPFQPCYHCFGAKSLVIAHLVNSFLTVLSLPLNPSSHSSQRNFSKMQGNHSSLTLYISHLFLPLQKVHPLKHSQQNPPWPVSADSLSVSTRNTSPMSTLKSSNILLNFQAQFMSIKSY